MIGKKGIVKSYKDKIQCHVCGSYFKALCSSHTVRMHGLDAYTYKKRFGLFNTQGLVGRNTKKKHRETFQCKNLNKGGGYSRGGNLGGEIREQQKIQKKYVFNPKWFLAQRSKETKECIKKYLYMVELRKKGLRFKKIAKIMNYKNPSTAINMFWKRKQVFLNN